MKKIWFCHILSVLPAFPGPQDFPFPSQSHLLINQSHLHHLVHLLICTHLSRKAALNPSFLDCLIFPPQLLGQSHCFQPPWTPLSSSLNAADFCWFPDSRLPVVALSAPVVRPRQTDQSNAVSVFCARRTVGFATSCQQWATVSPMPLFAANMPAG